MHAGRVACCYDEYVDGTNRQTDGSQTVICYITLSIGKRKYNNLGDKSERHVSDKTWDSRTIIEEAQTPSTSYNLTIQPL